VLYKTDASRMCSGNFGKMCTVETPCRLNDSEGGSGCYRHEVCASLLNDIVTNLSFPSSTVFPTYPFIYLSLIQLLDSSWRRPFISASAAPLDPSSH
jgi:hypothetical protein